MAQLLVYHIRDASLHVEQYFTCTDPMSSSPIPILWILTPNSKNNPRRRNTGKRFRTEFPKEITERILVRKNSRQFKEKRNRKKNLAFLDSPVRCGGDEEDDEERRRVFSIGHNKSCYRFQQVETFPVTLSRRWRHWLRSGSFYFVPEYFFFFF